MRGRNTLWILGTDHAGIGTQAVVEKELRAERASRATSSAARSSSSGSGSGASSTAREIVEQYKRLGASCDYERERFTLDEGYVRAVYRVFVALYEKGCIYRDNYMVNWDPGSRSAISDLEVENREVTDTLYEIDYPIEGSDEVLTVATVRPETMLADTAVAVHPDDERYSDLVGESLHPAAGRPAAADHRRRARRSRVRHRGAEDHARPRPERLRDRPRARARGDRRDRRGRADERRRPGSAFAGLTAAEAREAVVAALRERGPAARRGALHALGPVLAALRRADRAADLAAVVLPHGRARGAGDRGRRARRGPDRPRATTSASTSTGCANIRPWCVSRQLWWGHRMPVWYGPDGEEIVAESDERAASGARARASTRTRCARRRTSSTPGSARRCGRSRPSAGPTRPPQLRAFYPTSFLTTAREIIFLWVARMVMMGLEFAGDIPFRDVYVHPVIQAPDGRRMSKSLGTGIDPLDEIDVHGADALRFGLLAMSSTQDVRYSADRVQQGRDLANKMWNASRLVLLNAGDARARAAAARRSRTAGSSRGCSARSSASAPSARRLRLRPRRARASTRSSGRSSATGTWRSSSRGSTTATRTPRRTCSACSSGCSRSPIR